MKFFNLTTGKPNNEDLTEFENLLTGKFKCFKWKHTKKWAPDICIRIEIVVQQAAIIYTYSESIFFLIYIPNIGTSSRSSKIDIQIFHCIKFMFNNVNTIISLNFISIKQYRF